MIHSTSSNDLNPKKFILHGHVRFNEKLVININVFQDASTVMVVKSLFDLLTDFFDLKVRAVDAINALDLFMSNDKLLVVETQLAHNGVDVGTARIESNGSRVPSCSFTLEITNILWTDVSWHDRWRVNFEYRKGKWLIDALTTAFMNKATHHSIFEQQALDLVELIRGTRSDL